MERTKLRIFGSILGQNRLENSWTRENRNRVMASLLYHLQLKRAVCVCYVGLPHMWENSATGRGRTALLIARNRRSFFRQTKRRMLPTPRVAAAKRRWSDHRFRDGERKREGNPTHPRSTYSVPKIQKKLPSYSDSATTLKMNFVTAPEPRTHNYRSQTEREKNLRLTVRLVADMEISREYTC